MRRVEERRRPGGVTLAVDRTDGRRWPLLGLRAGPAWSAGPRGVRPIWSSGGPAVLGQSLSVCVPRRDGSRRPPLLGGGPSRRAGTRARRGQPTPHQGDVPAPRQELAQGRFSQGASLSACLFLFLILRPPRSGAPGLQGQESNLRGWSGVPGCGTRSQSAPLTSLYVSRLEDLGASRRCTIVRALRSSILTRQSRSRPEWRYNIILLAICCRTARRTTDFECVVGRAR